MICQQCGREAAPEAKFCVDCGSPLVLQCPACQTPFELGSRFCSHCGRSLPEVAPPLSHEALEQTGKTEKESESIESELSVVGQQPAIESFRSYSCPRCHQSNTPDAEYCFACGMPLQDSDSSVRPFNADETFDSTSTAGFWIRVGAYLVDTVVLMFLLFVVAVVYGVYEIATTGDESFDFIDRPYFGFLPYLMVLVYHTVLVGLWATTVGKRLFGLYVLHSNSSRIGLGRALARHLASYVSGLLLGIGYLQVAFREDKLSLHDQISRTMVVKRGKRPQGLWHLSSSRLHLACSGYGFSYVKTRFGLNHAD